MFIYSIILLLRLTSTAIWRKTFWVYIRAKGKPLRIPIKARTRREAETLVRRIGFTEQDILSIQED